MVPTNEILQCLSLYLLNNSQLVLMVQLQLIPTKSPRCDNCFNNNLACGLIFDTFGPDVIPEWLHNPSSFFLFAFLGLINWLWLFL
ncbi:hypothetical protein BDV11DRAFT_201353 [Aspergillus similis]